MRALIAVCLLFSGFFTATAKAEVTVRDPKNVLGDIRRWSTPVAFDKAFTCGQAKTFNATAARCDVRCTSMCMTRCEEAKGFEAKFDLHVDDCKLGTDGKLDSVSIYGDNGLSVEIRRDEYNAGSQTWLLPLLKQAFSQWVQPDGELILESLWPAQVSKIEGGRKQPISSARELNLDLSFGAGKQMQRVQVILDLSQGGLEQILIVGLGHYRDKNSDVFMRLRGVVAEPLGGSNGGGIIFR